MHLVLFGMVAGFMTNVLDLPDKTQYFHRVLEQATGSVRTYPHVALNYQCKLEPQNQLIEPRRIESIVWFGLIL